MDVSKTISRNLSLAGLLQERSSLVNPWSGVKQLAGRYRFLLPFVFPIISVLHYFTNLHSTGQPLWEHLTEEHVIAVYISSVLFSLFIWYSDRASEQFQQQLLVYKEVLEKIPTDIAVFDDEHRYVFVNPEAILDPKLREWMLGKDDFEYCEYRGHDRSMAVERREKFKKALATKSPVWWVDTTYSRTRGTRHVQRTFNPVFNDGGELDRMFGFGADVTELMQLRIKDENLSANMRYANQIQQFLLPDMKQLESTIGEAFVIWKPRNVVSGDFYWHHRSADTTYVAVADCTGHGVSGALLTVICMDALNRCVNEFKLTSPAAILNKCQELLSESWKLGSQGGMEDGMDLCLLGFGDNGSLTFSSAASTMYHIRNNELAEHKGDKVSLGQNWRNHLFKDTTMQLQLGDLIYMATDGVTDQFGGNNDKKYGRPRLRNIIGNMVKQPFELQRHKFHQHLEDWRGNKEQVDDKTLLGIRYSPKVSHK
jgi:serine phosphatase RsbU (regulator of sigma subunit)/PAS domain-containing protein